MAFFYVAFFVADFLLSIILSHCLFLRLVALSFSFAHENKDRCSAFLRLRAAITICHSNMVHYQWSPSKDPSTVSLYRTPCSPHGQPMSKAVAYFDEALIYDYQRPSAAVIQWPWLLPMKPCHVSTI